MKYVIIGASFAAIGAAEAIRSADADRELTIFSDEPYRSYARPLISYYLEGRVPAKKMWYRPDEFYSDSKLFLRLGAKVEHVDTDRRIVRAADGTECEYDRLLVCSGSRPFIPDIPGIDANNVFGFKKWDDAKRIRKLTKSKKRVVVMGGGLIGIKATESLTNLGLKVTIVSKGANVLHLILDDAASGLARKRLDSAGVRMITGNNPVEILSKKNGDVKGVALENGKTLNCDILVVGKGVRPNVGFLQDSPIQIDGGVIVDRFMKTSVDGVYAAGDVAQAWDPLHNKNSIIAIAPLAYEQGMVAGLNMAGRHAMYGGGISMNSIEVFGLPFMSMGIANKAPDDCEQETFIDGERYRKLVFHDNKLIGAILASDVSYGGVLTQLIRNQCDTSFIRQSLAEYVEGERDFASILPAVIHNAALKKASNQTAAPLG